MAASSLLSLAAVLLQLMTCMSSQCASEDSAKLRFVARLSVNGCTLFVHDTGANDGPHLTIEPIMCVTERLHNVAPRYDSITHQTYLSVPVMLRDDTMLAEVQRHLRHLSPKSVKFATVSDINVSSENSLKFQALGFDWTQEDPAGILRLGCKNAAFCAHLVFAIRVSKFESLDSINFFVSIQTSDVKTIPRKYKLVLKDQTHFQISTSSTTDLKNCEQLRFVRTIRLINCTARVHQRLDMKGHFLIEPLLCHNNMKGNESIMFDYSRDMYYLKLNIVLEDDMTADAVRTQLADLSPRSVAFMRLWRAQSHVASALSPRFMIGPLMVSEDWRSAQLRVYCMTEDECCSLRQSVSVDPFSLWRHVKWTVTLLVDLQRCALVSPVPRSAFPARTSYSLSYELNLRWSAACQLIRLELPNFRRCQFASLPDGRIFVIIQQRLTGSVSFQQGWTEYERGFGNGSDFWIGLTAIHSLSMNGATLRVNMRLWNGTELHAEYVGFKVGDASTEYTMTYREMQRDRSSMSYDALQPSRGMQFSTMDRDNDRSSDSSCSNDWGDAGWWFNSCMSCHPNGLFEPQAEEPGSRALWYADDSPGKQALYLSEVRMMLQI